MMLGFLLFALVVSGVGVWMSRRWQGLGRGVTVVGVLCLITSVALEVRANLFPPKAESPDRRALAVGVCLGNFVVRDLEAQSGAVVLLFPPRSLMDAHQEQGYEDGFAASLRHGQGALHLKALHLEAEKGQSTCSLAAFKRELEQVPDALAYVSFAGAPAGFNTLFSAGQPKIAPFYVFEGQETIDWLAPLKDGHVRAVVLPRPGVAVPAHEPAGGRPEAILEQYYLVATRQTADQVAAQLSVKP